MEFCASNWSIIAKALSFVKLEGKWSALMVMEFPPEFDISCPSRMLKLWALPIWNM